mmetsp:Transcript_8044/g.11345  ORF Transcript_8044/g.11345 Transcript_8044/m.11345 type:complete len:142 (+) Transcript_8044:98-523(+)
MSDIWFYVSRETNAQTGPCTVSDLCDLFERGTISDDCYMWTEGQPGWVTLKEIPSLSSKVKAPKISKAPPPIPLKPKPSAAAQKTDYHRFSNESAGNFELAQETIQGSGLSEDASAALSKKRKLDRKVHSGSYPLLFQRCY